MIIIVFEAIKPVKYRWVYGYRWVYITIHYNLSGVQSVRQKICKGNMIHL